MTGDTLQTAELQHAFSRIAALEAQLKQARDERDEARRLAQWTPITPENLPKLGDELLERFSTGVYWVHPFQQNPHGKYSDYGLCVHPFRNTHFRPITPPEVKP